MRSKIGYKLVIAIVLFSSMITLIATALQLFKIVDVNQATLELHHAKSKEELIDNLNTIITENSLNTFKEEIIAIADGQLDFETEGEVRTLTGERRYIFLRLSIDKEQPEAIKAVRATIDITARKQAEEEKAKLEGQLRQAHKMEAIGTLAGGIAHDFNNILGLIVGNVELAIDDIPHGKPARFNLREARNACVRAMEMVKQILAFSRQEEKLLRPINVQPIVVEAIKMLRASIPATVEIQQHIALKNAVILGDQTQMHQILINLCSNAAQAMEEMGGVLQVSLANINVDKEAVKGLPELRSGKYIRLTVSDTGHGIQPDIISKVFDPYFTTNEVGKGTGMGLAAVYGIVKDHGGTVKVYSEVDMGTTFHVFFPELKHEYEAQEITQESIPVGNEKILFVDDELALVDLGQRMLESLGYTVESRTSSIEALEAFKKNPDKFDLVVSDMTMPNMTGDILAKELMVIRSDIPIIICTGFSPRIDQKTAAELGIRGLVMKPFIRSEIATTIRRVLDER